MCLQIICIWNQTNIYKSYVYETKPTYTNHMYMKPNQHIQIICIWNQTNIYKSYVYETKPTYTNHMYMKPNQPKRIIEQRVEFRNK